MPNYTNQVVKGATFCYKRNHGAILVTASERQKSGIKQIADHQISTLKRYQSFFIVLPWK